MYACACVRACVRACACVCVRVCVCVRPAHACVCAASAIKGIKKILFHHILLSEHCYSIIYIYTTVLPLSCTDGRYFYHISGTALFSGTNYDFFGAIVIFLLHFGYTNFKSRNGL